MIVAPVIADVRRVLEGPANVVEHLLDLREQLQAMSQAPKPPLRDGPIHRPLDVLLQVIALVCPLYDRTPEPSELHPPLPLVHGAPPLNELHLFERLEHPRHHRPRNTQPLPKLALQPPKPSHQLVKEVVARTSQRVLLEPRIEDPKRRLVSALQPKKRRVHTPRKAPPMPPPFKIGREGSVL